MHSKLSRALFVGAALSMFLLTGGDRLRAVSTGVVISQVYGGGGATTGAPSFKNDYIELFNRGNVGVSLAGMSVQYASSTGNFTQVTILPNVTLQPGQYFLVQQGTAAGALGATLPTPDASGTISMSATTGKVALVNGTAALGNTGCPSSASVIDLLGFGPGANCAEGTPTAALTNTTAAIRAVHGCTDTDANSSDFANGTPAPRNSATALAPCGGGDTAPSVSSTAPAAGATNVAANSTIVINFSESVTASAAAFSLQCPAGSPQAFTASPAAGTPATQFTLTPTSPLPLGASCTVTVTAAQVSDVDAIDPPDTMSGNHVFSFTTQNPADTAPSVFSTSPANGAGNVAVTAPITITFSESVTASATAFSLECPAGAAQMFSQSAGPAATYTLTPSAALPYSTTCTVSVAANEISDTDTNDPPDGLLSNASVAFTTGAAPPPGTGIVMINEMDADTPGDDAAEFIELYDGGAGNTALDGMVVVLYEGGTGTGAGARSSYAAFDLDGYSTDANGYFTMGNPGVAAANLVFDPGQFGLVSNGPDAVALYLGSAGDFPNGTVVTTTNLQDAIVYGTDDPNATGLLSLLNAGQKIANENATGSQLTQSNQRCPNGMGGFRNTSTYYPGAPTPGAVNACPAPRPPSAVVISQVYGGGGNGGATFSNDFVELYNRTADPVDLTGWSLQYASSTGSGWDTNKQPLGGSIGSGEYYLIALASGGAVGASLPPANIDGQINLAAGSGKVALVSSFTGLVGGCPLYDAALQDFVGFGAADCGEGSSTTAAGSNTTALFRKGDGGTDTDHNANDFNPPAAPAPRRTAPIVELGPNVLSTDPRFNGTNAPRDATIQVTFTEPVSVDAGWFTLTCASSGPHASATFALSFGGRDHYITPNDNFIEGEQCAVTVLGNRIHDLDLEDGGAHTDTLPADYSWSFTVATGAAPAYPSSVHLTMGAPTNAGSDPADYLMDKPEFTLSYNSDLGRPNWVSWHLSDDWIGTLSRVDTFRPDPQIPPDWYRVQAFDFSGSGFDRGHMVPNADRDKETSIPINQATFLMTNMIAQSPGNNQGPWALFEGYLRTLIEQQGSEVYIVAGPSGVGGTGTNGGATTLAGGKVTVPSDTWKVALVLPKDNGDDLSRVNCSTRTIAVIMPNLETLPGSVVMRNTPWENYLTTVDAVEALAGYDLFSNLPEPYQQCIEAGTNGNNPPLVKGSQTIVFPQPLDTTYGDPAFTLSATGGASGNPVTFVAAGSCTSAGSNGATITLGPAGSCTVTASQAGNDIYNAADDVVRTFTIHKATPAFAALTSPTIEVGSASTVIGGVLAAGTLVPSGTVAVTLDGVTLNAPIAANGSFSASFAASTLTVANSPYVISFGYAGDTNFSAATGASSLTVVDSTAPVLGAISATPGVIRPPNHKLVNIQVSYAATDAGSIPVCALTVSSNEAVNGTGDGNTAADWVIFPLDPHRVQVRAERAGNGNGRIYTITATCTDAQGNSTSKSTTVTVAK
jgi:endonuclease G